MNKKSGKNVNFKHDNEIEEYMEVAEYNENIYKDIANIQERTDKIENTAQNIAEKLLGYEEDISTGKRYDNTREKKEQNVYDIKYIWQKYIQSPLKIEKDFMNQDERLSSALEKKLEEIEKSSTRSRDFGTFANHFHKILTSKKKATNLSDLSSMPKQFGEEKKNTLNSNEQDNSYEQKSVNVKNFELKIKSKKKKPVLSIKEITENFTIMRLGEVSEAKLMEEKSKKKIEGEKIKNVSTLLKEEFENEITNGDLNENIGMFEALKHQDFEDYFKEEIEIGSSINQHNKDTNAKLDTPLDINYHKYLSPFSRVVIGAYDDKLIMQNNLNYVPAINPAQIGRENYMTAISGQLPLNKIFMRRNAQKDVQSEESEDEEFESEPLFDSRKSLEEKSISPLNKAERRLKKAKMEGSVFIKEFGDGELNTSEEKELRRNARSIEKALSPKKAPPSQPRQAKKASSKVKAAKSPKLNKTLNDSAANRTKRSSKDSKSVKRESYSRSSHSKRDNMNNISEKIVNRTELEIESILEKTDEIIEMQKGDLRMKNDPHLEKELVKRVDANIKKILKILDEHSSNMALSDDILVHISQIAQQFLSAPITTKIHRLVLQEYRKNQETKNQEFEKLRQDIMTEDKFQRHNVLYSSMLASPKAEDQEEKKQKQKNKENQDLFTDKPLRPLSPRKPKQSPPRKTEPRNPASTYSTSALSRPQKANSKRQIQPKASTTKSKAQKRPNINYMKEGWMKRTIPSNFHTSSHSGSKSYRKKKDYSGRFFTNTGKESTGKIRKYGPGKQIAIVSSRDALRATTPPPNTNKANTKPSSKANNNHTQSEWIGNQNNELNEVQGWLSHTNIHSPFSSSHQSLISN